MSQVILEVSDDGNFLKYIPKEIGHKGKGRRHLAIAVLLFNSKGQVLLQKRKHKIFDNIWDITGATHPLHQPHLCHSERSEESQDSNIEITTSSSTFAQSPRNDKRCKACKQDNIDETLKEATLRCLKEEWDIGDIGDIAVLGKFNYFSPYHTVQGDYCENEHCFLMVGEYNGEVRLNPQSGYEYKWVDKEEFLKDIKLNPKNFTPWAIESARILI
ncbi:NUDIX domain-containing protein [Candidatus Daviesbacteria bacterium]|nr:NUDIX domain-containing protein [Candidatus Daviesbacteria bacterium]